jgi:hypothetical protein
MRHLLAPVPAKQLLQHMPEYKDSSQSDEAGPGHRSLHMIEACHLAVLSLDYMCACQCMCDNLALMYLEDYLRIAPSLVGHASSMEGSTYMQPPAEY